jgi:DNA replication protein DnaC
VLDEQATPSRASAARRASGARSRPLASSVIPRRYRGVSFDRAPVTELPSTIVRPVREFVRNVDDRIRAGRGLWVFGDVGTGKTTLAMLASKEALKRGTR